MIKSLRFQTRWLYHPVTVFLSIQVLWILLIVVWIRWYLEKHAQLREMAERLRAQAEVETGWFPLVEGGAAACPDPGRRHHDLHLLEQAAPAEQDAAGLRLQRDA